MDSTSPVPEVLGLEAQALAAEARIDTHLREPRGASKALQVAIEALELLMQARAQASSQERKLQLKEKFKQLMTRAEHIKKESKRQELDEELEKQKQNWQPAEGELGLNETQQAMGRLALSSLNCTPDATPPNARPAEPPTPTVLKAPKSTRTLSTREQTIVLRSSKVAGHIFPPWESEPTFSDFSSAELFSDSTGKLPLSDAQIKILDSWKRPAEIHPPPKKVTVVPETPIDLAQDAITDCSIVASLCAAISREEKGHSKIVSSIIHPQDGNGSPQISPNGKYIIKLYLNGCYRKVVIDDYLPTSTNDRALHVVCRSNPTLIWPALIEKAYLKVMGGYDFPGSNSGTDLFALTGWIPEHVFLQSDDIMPGSLWKRIFKAWGFGDVLVTLGTGLMTNHEEEEHGLASEHDYAVLDLREIDGRRLALVKNPWSEGAIWKGGLDHLDSDSEDEDEDDEEGEPEEWTEWDESLALPIPSSPGQFWIDLDHICRHFANIYLNWNPGLFLFRYDHHLAWDLRKNEGRMCKTSFAGHPQFSVKNPSGSKSATVWLLLQRHIQGQLVAMGGPRAGYISLYVFDNGGKRVYLSDGTLIRGPYVDSPQTLLRLDSVPPNTTYTVVVSSQDLAAEQHSFSLSALSDYPLKTSVAEEVYPFERRIPYAWVPHNAGGNAQSPTYSTNPQFKLTLHRNPTSASTNLTLLLESSDELSVHVKLVWGSGRRIATVTTRDIIAESGEYRRGCALAEVGGIQCPGVYTVVASTFERGQVGDFVLRVMGGVEMEIEPIRAETAGKLTKTITGTWPIQGATASNNQQCTCLAFPIFAPRLTRLSIVARNSLTPKYSKPLLRITFQRRLSSEYLTQNTYYPYAQRAETLGTSGPGWSDAPQGVRTGDVDVEGQQGIGGGMWEYWAVLESMRGEGEEGYEVVVLADGIVEVGGGVAVEGWVEDV